jgi:hypothetical protein
VDLFTGLVFRRPPTIEAPDGMSNFVEDCTMSGVSLEKFSRKCVDEVLTVGRCGILVDYPDTATGAGLTQADVEALNLRPRLAFYTTESIENWQEEWRRNQYVLTMIQLVEAADKKRVLLLDSDNVYSVQVWTKDAKGAWYVSSTAVPLMNGAPLDFIPFYVADPMDGDMTPDNPPLLDLVNVNLSHYRTVADLELGRQKTALPTFWATGFTQDDNQPIRLGAGNAIISSNNDAQFGLLEFTGQGLGALETAEKDKREWMSKLGADMLSQSADNVESGEARQIKKAGEDGVLASIANAVSQTLTAAMIVARDWYGLTGDAFIELNTRYYQKTANPQELVALMGQVQSGQMSSRRLWAYMQERDIVPRDVAYEQVREEIDDDGALMVGSVDAGQ